MKSYQIILILTISLFILSSCTTNQTAPTTRIDSFLALPLEQQDDILAAKKEPTNMLTGQIVYAGKCKEVGAGEVIYNEKLKVVKRSPLCLHSQRLREYQCSSSEEFAWTDYFCTKGCLDNACVNDEKREIKPTRCSETDFGLNPSLAGQVDLEFNLGSALTKRDICKDSTVTEYYCNDQNYGTKQMACSYGCAPDQKACSPAPDYTKQWHQLASCKHLEQGYYKMTQNFSLSPGEQSCITLSSDTVVNCQGFSPTNPSKERAVAFSIISQNNVTLQNCRVMGFDFG